MIATQLPMAGNPADQNHDRLEDTQRLRREIDNLRARLKRDPNKTNHLSWDTELLHKKTEHFGPDNTISATRADWKQTLDKIRIGAYGLCIADVRTVDAIEHIAEFAARRQLTMTYGNGSFLLEPRDPNTLA